MSHLGLFKKKFECFHQRVDGECAHSFINMDMVAIDDYVFAVAAAVATAHSIQSVNQSILRRKRRNKNNRFQ